MRIAYTIATLKIVLGTIKLDWYGITGKNSCDWSDAYTLKTRQYNQVQSIQR